MIRNGSLPWTPFINGSARLLSQGHVLVAHTLRKALREIACVAKPDTILAWYRKLIAQKFDGSQHRQYPGRPRIDEKLEALIVRMARDNSGWGYDRIVGALANLGHTVSDQTVGNVLRRH